MIQFVLFTDAVAHAAAAIRTTHDDAVMLVAHACDQEGIQNYGATEDGKVHPLGRPFWELVKSEKMPPDDMIPHVSLFDFNTWLKVRGADRYDPEAPPPPNRLQDINKWDNWWLKLIELTGLGAPKLTERELVDELFQEALTQQITNPLNPGETISLKTIERKVKKALSRQGRRAD